MKIAIMTQPLGRNYGGLMQAYALQKVIRDAGHDVVTVNRHHNNPKLVKSIVRGCFRLVMRLIGRERSEVFVERYESEIYRENFRFIEKYIALTPRLDTDHKMALFFNRNTFDVFVVGSDQTWRPSYSPNIYNYFLDFIDDDNVKRIAYASSFGVDIWEFDGNLTRSCSQLAKKFNSISVRETSAVQLCEKYLGVEAKIVLDPTFLLDVSIYHDLIKNYKSSVKPGIFSYILDPTDSKVEIKNALVTVLELNVISYEPEISQDFLKSVNVLTELVKPSVLEWLAEIANAEFVVTDSFHGVVFSLIFEKRFIAVVNQGRGAARFYSLLSQLGLESRIIDKSSDKEIIKLVDSIDYITVNSKLNVLKEQSRQFLFESILSGV